MTHLDYQRARDQRGLTNARIARQIMVSESYVCKVMKGERPVTRELQHKGFYQILGLPEPQDAKKSA